MHWFNIMSYDLHGTWDQGNAWTGAYLNAHSNLAEIDLPNPQCKWTGYVLMLREDPGKRGKEYMSDETGCGGVGSHACCTQNTKSIKLYTLYDSIIEHA